MSYLYQMEPVFDEDDVNEVADCVRSSWVLEAHRTAEFEKQLAEYCGTKYAIVVPSCTVALALSLMAAGVGPGDEVLVPDLTFIATANAVSLVGATPVFVDIHPQRLGLNSELVVQALTPRTKAILPVWLNGRPGDITQLVHIAQQYGLALIEDAACGLGSRWQGQHAGSFGDCGCISFNTTKIITTGTGGVVLTNRPDLFEKIERLKNHGRLDRRYIHPEIGFNFGFSDLLAALGLAQLKKLPHRVAKKKQLSQWYFEQLKNVPGVSFYPAENDEVCLWYPEIFLSDPAGFQTFMAQHEIQVRPYYPPLHQQPCYATSGEYPVATRVAGQGMWLPAADYVTQEMVTKVCERVSEWALMKR